MLSAPRQLGVWLLSPASPPSMGCLFLHQGRALLILGGGEGAGSSAAGLPHALLGTAGRCSSGRPLQAPLPMPSPGPARPAGAAWLRVHLKPRSTLTPNPP